MRAGIGEVPDGVYRFHDFLDDDGVTDEPVKIAVELTLDGEELYADFTGTSQQVLGPLNARLSAARACVYYAAKAVIDPDLPTCAGAYRPIHVSAPEGTILQATYPAAIGNAKRYIFIENSYFSDVKILHALVQARLRGVDVRVIMSLDGNHGIMNQANVKAANILLAAGARIYNYDGMSHVKAAVYDGWAVLGSANFDRLSFRINREMNLASSAPEFTKQVLEHIFAADFAHSEELTAPLKQTWRHSMASILASQL